MASRKNFTKISAGERLSPHAQTVSCSNWLKNEGIFFGNLDCYVISKWVNFSKYSKFKKLNLTRLRGGSSWIFFSRRSKENKRVNFITAENDITRNIIILEWKFGNTKIALATIC